MMKLLIHTERAKTVPKKKIKKIYSKIAEFRNSLGLTQAELAELVGVDTQTVSNWENHKSLGQFERVSRLCKVFECEPHALIEYRNVEINDHNGNSKDQRLKEIREKLLSLQEQQTKNDEIENNE